MLLLSLVSATPSKGVNADHTRKLEGGLHLGLLPRLGPFMEYKHSESWRVRTAVLLGVSIFNVEKLSFTQGLQLPITLQFYPKANRKFSLLVGMESGFGFNGKKIDQKSSYRYGPYLAVIGGASWNFTDQLQISVMPKYGIKFAGDEGVGIDFSLGYKFL